MKNKFYILIIIAFFTCFSNSKAQEFIPNTLTHSIGVNGGYTIIFNKYSGFNLGINYEMKKLKNNFGIGFFANYIVAKNEEMLFGLPIFAHNAFGVENLVLTVAPGIGYNGSINYLLFQKEDPNSEYIFLTHQERLNLLVRLGAECEFKLPDKTDYNFTINPYINADVLAFNKVYLTLGIKVNYLIY